MRRPPLVVLAVVLVLASASAHAGGSAVNRPLLGVAGQADRFQAQTGQDSQVRHLFLGWGQGSTWGSPFAQLFEELKPVPMIHIGTDEGRARTEAITPAQIAAGRGDAYLVALNEAVAAYGGELYVRLLAEMNNPKNHYAPTRPNGTSKGASHSAALYKQAFRRAYLILHGGANVDAKLRRLGLPPVGRELAVNEAPLLTVIWNPIAGFEPRSPRPAQQFYPGDAYVDMVGNDIFATRAGIASHAANEALYRAHPKKPYALAEWGTSIDDPGFVQRICRFLRTHQRVRVAAYYDARPTSAYDLGSKPRARAEYRRCITPIGAKPSQPGSLPTVPPTSAQLRLAAAPGSGDAPLAVGFGPYADLPKPVLRWELAFGDGNVQAGSGPPPAAVTYTYARKGIYTAALVAYLAPPYTTTAVRYLTQVRVTVGMGAKELLRLTPAPRTGKAPFSVSFRAAVNTPAPVTRWDFVPGDGTSRSSDGKPPRFLGHTYTQRGTYRAVLIVHLGAGERIYRYVDIAVR
jgi:hypothetical protein